MKLYSLQLLLFSILAVFVFSACSAGSGGAASAIEAYNKALVAKDADALATLSCAAWEADARSELESFGAVATTLADQQCQEAGKDGEATLVNCTGKISANYNGEILEINLSDRAYAAVEEGGEWRMCGYR